MALIQFAPRNLSSFITKGNNLSESESKSQKLDPIDAVITWVDGDDPKLKAKRRQFLGLEHQTDRQTRERFSEVGELYYCIASILKNASFIKRIFIVTDDQYPTHLERIRTNFGEDAFSKIRVVDHSEIFQGHEENLPVFNSVSIETLLHRIPDLSNRYIYFNDDFFIVKKVSELDFFVDEKPVLRGEFLPSRTATFYQTQRERKNRGQFALSNKKFSYKETQYLSFLLLGFDDKYFWHDHTPHPFFKKTVKKLEETHETSFLQNIKHRERHHSQWDIMAAAAAMEIQHGNEEFRETSLTYLKPCTKKFQTPYIWRKKIQFYFRKSKFICLQSLSEAKPHTQKLCEDWLIDLLDMHSCQ